MTSEDTDTTLIDAIPGSIVEATYEHPTERRSWVVTVVAALSVLAIVGGGFAYISSQQQRIDTQVERAAAQSALVAELVEENKDLRRNSEGLYNQLLELGEQPQGQDPDTISGTQGLRGERGPMGRPGLDGLPGEPGEDGATGERGPQGPGGEQGSTGEQGPRGEAGPVGPAGPQGPQGAAGSHGVGIVGILCADDGTWVFSMSDSSTISVAGPCRVVDLP